MEQRFGLLCHQQAKQLAGPKGPAFFVSAWFNGALEFRARATPDQTESAERG